MTTNINMTFACNQDWEQMKVSGQGRHCELCSKMVFDFTDKSLHEIEKEGKGELCGMFRIEQVEPGLKLIETPFSMRTTLFTVAAVLGLELSHVNGQVLERRHYIEKVDFTKTDTVVTGNGKQVNVTASKVDDCKNVTRPVRRRYYFSKRFPFIVKRRHRTIGRFRF